MMRRLLGATLLALWLPGSAVAFVIQTPPTRLPDGSFTFQAQILLSGNPNSPSGTSWNQAFAAAAGQWNAATPLVGVGVNQGVFEDPCLDNGTNGIHGVGFTADVCGDAFGASTLAVARRFFSTGGLVTEGDIVFKETANWNVYSGPLQPSVSDFQRVAVHEIGHLLGLDHENSLPAIMESFTSNIDAPQTDDVNGIVAIYQLGCPVTISAGPGIHNDTLGVTDCFDTEVGLPLPVGLSGVTPETNSFVDMRRVTLPNGGTLQADMTAPAFNPVVQVMDLSLTTQLAAEWAPAGGSAASVSPVVAPGSYIVVARSIFDGSGGSYSLTLTPEPSQWLLAISALGLLGLLARGRTRS